MGEPTMGDDYFTPTERKVDDLFIKWCDAENLNRDQTAFVDIYWAMGAISNGGIHGFWENLSEQADRIIESFRIGRQAKLADLLDASRFLLEARLDDEGCYLLNDKESQVIFEAEQMLSEDSFIAKLSEFAEQIREDL
jgi:hypothetical protein